VIVVIIDAIADSHHFPFEIIGYPHFLITFPVLITSKVSGGITGAARIGSTVICVFIFLTMLSLFF
jgi:hypothetical protein